MLSIHSQGKCLPGDGGAVPAYKNFPPSQLTFAISLRSEKARLRPADIPSFRSCRTKRMIMIFAQARPISIQFIILEGICRKQNAHNVAKTKSK
jgi:hypothetical protein